MEIAHSPYAPEAIRYGFGRWIEGMEGQRNVLEVSGGAFGWMPFIGCGYGYGGLFGVKDCLRNVLMTIGELQCVLRAQLG